MFIQSSLLILPLFALRVAARVDCASLRSFFIPGVVISNAVHLTAGTTFPASADPTCFTPTFVNSVDVCRVTGVITTSPTSSVAFEMWLPDTWYGRVLTTGNGGLGGCVGYATLDQGAALHFATIGTNNGHDGSFDPIPFLLPLHLETLTDFSHRAVHVAAKNGKKIASRYYGTVPHHSYYNGCSAGGRQGISVASRYPEDFDGIIAGTPALDWNNFVGAAAIWASYVADNTSSAIPLPLWDTLIAQEVLNQCDGLDGKVDGIITDPSLCSWNPDTLLCGADNNGTSCLTQDQVNGLKKLYQPILGTNGKTLVSRYDPGAEADTALQVPMNGMLPITTLIWYDYAIYNDPTRSLNGFSVADLEFANTVDPVGISTWSNAVNGLAQFRDNGGKVLTFHGTRDPVIPSGQSKRFHDLLSSTIPPPSRWWNRSPHGHRSPHSARDWYHNPPTGHSLEDFYRLFMVPGMGHCAGGLGAWKMGQAALVGTPTDAPNLTDHNVLLSLVDWVEGGNAPPFMIGTDEAGQGRKHCLWPTSKSVWTGSAWDCVPA